MLFARTLEDCQPKDFSYDDRGICRAVHAIIRELVGGNASRVKRAKACFIAKKRPAGHRHATSEQGIDRGVKPNNRNALRAQKFRSALLGVGSATQCEHDRFFHFGGAAERSAKLVGFERPKCLFAMALEKFGDAEAGRFFDAVVQVDEAPCKLARAMRAN